EVAADDRHRTVRVVTETEDEPVGETRSAAVHDVAPSGHPDRDAPLRAREDRRAVDAMVLPGVVDERFAPGQAQHLDSVFPAWSPALDVLVERLVLDEVPPDADTKSEAAVREQVDLGRLLRDQRRLPLGENEDGGDELQRAGYRRDETEEHERLVEG